MKAAASGDIVASFAILDRLGCAREVGGLERHAKLATEYVAAIQCGESALMVGQTWTEVHAVNESIRERLKATGVLGGGTSLVTFQAVDATVAQRRDPSFYHAGQHAFFVQRYGR